MIDERKTLARSLAFLAREAGRNTEAHPSPEALVAYRAGELSPEEDQGIQEHLVFCFECPDLLLALQDFSDPSSGSTSISEAGIAAAWRRLRRRLIGESRFDNLPGVFRHWLALPRPALAFSVACLVTALAAPWFLLATSGKPDVLAAVELEAPSRGDTIQLIEFSETRKEPLALTASPVGRLAYPEYEVTLSGATGRRLLSRRWRPRAESALLVVQLPRSTPAGDYLLRLRGIEHGHPAAEPPDERRFHLAFR